MEIYPGRIVCFEGPLRAGKTLHMTLEGARAFAAGHTVYANYETMYSQQIDSIDDLYNCRSGVLMLDELQATMDSRQSKDNVELTQWLVLIGKLGLTLFYTTQWIGQVDVRLRNVTTDLYRCRRRIINGNKATLVTTYDLYAGEGTQRNKYILHHNAGLYALYNTLDIKVKLTKEGRVTSFDPNADAVAPAPVRRTSKATATDGR